MKLQSAEAGVNDGKAGLLSSAGLFHKAGIFDKKSESFNIQNLNPYLLFDAESSMKGTLEAPTLDLDPTLTRVESSSQPQRTRCGLTTLMECL